MRTILLFVGLFFATFARAEGERRIICMWDDDLGREFCEEYVYLCTFATGGGEVCAWVSARAIEGGD